MPITSVIIPARNEQDYIRATLESYARQTQPCEVIVVANGCDPDDDTANIAEDLGAMVTESKPGIAIAKNHGASVSRGGIMELVEQKLIIGPLAL